MLRTLNGCVEIINIGCMVFIMVDFHGTGVDMRLERIKIVRERW